MKAEPEKKLIILGSAWPLRGGLAAYNERLARAFIEAGWTVRIFTFSLQYPSFLFPGKTQYSDAPKPIDLNIEVCVNSINPINWLKTARKIRKFNPDLLIIKFWIPFMAPVLGTIARRSKAKVISVLDNVIPHEKRAGDKLLIRYFLKSVDAFIAMSQSVADDLIHLKPKAVFALNPHPLYDNFGNAVEKSVARERLSLEKEGRYLLFFGFIRDYKGLDILLDAMKDERIKELGVRLIIAGEFYSDSAPYLKQIEENRIGDRLILATDFIPDDKVGVYFSASDLIVQPYKSATQSGVTQIAYHFEKPMVVTDVGGLAEIVPHGKAGYVVNADASEIADAIIDFYTKKEPNFFIEGVKAEKKKYSWEQMLSSIEKLYQDILKSENQNHDNT